MNEKYICLKLTNGENIIARNPVYQSKMLIVEDPWLYILNNNGRRIVYALVGPWQAFGKIKKGDTVTVNTDFVINSYTNIHDTIIEQYTSVVDKEFEAGDIYVDTNEDKSYNKGSSISAETFSGDREDLEEFFKLLTLDKKKFH